MAALSGICVNGSGIHIWEPGKVEHGDVDYGEGKLVPEMSRLHFPFRPLMVKFTSAMWGALLIGSAYFWTGYVPNVK
ncbi:MAG: hypothetical protein ACLTKE_01320 [Coprococcus sp.]